MDQQLLDIRNLTLTIPTAHGEIRILDEVNFSLARGETASFVGESGCGKSMTVMAVMGLLPDAIHAQGQILFDGEDLLTLPDEQMCRIRGRRIGMIFQEPMTALNPVMTIGDQIAEGMLLHLGIGKSEAARRTVRLLDRVGLPAPRFSPDLYPHQLSGGQRQRVVIALALACEPDLLIADEPTTALDVTVQAQILDLIMDVTEERGMGLIMITHDLGVVAETTENVMVMYAGQVVEQGLTDKVFLRMAHPYTRALFAASPHTVAAMSDQARPHLTAIAGMVPDPGNRPPGCAFAPRCERKTIECDIRPRLVAWQNGHDVACYHPFAEKEGG